MEAADEANEKTMQIKSAKNVRVREKNRDKHITKLRSKKKILTKKITIFIVM